ncbi:hypothetical protein Hanom_Chr01g00010511 [Helianthus anomalus]
MLIFLIKLMISILMEVVVSVEHNIIESSRIRSKLLTLKLTEVIKRWIKIPNMICWSKQQWRLRNQRSKIIASVIIRRSFSFSCCCSFFLVSVLMSSQSLRTVELSRTKLTWERLHAFLFIIDNNISTFHLFWPEKIRIHYFKQNS